MSEIITTYCLTNEYNHTIIFASREALADFINNELECLNCIGDEMEFKVCQNEMTRSDYEALEAGEWEGL